MVEVVNCIPTYNEKEYIEFVLHKLLSILADNNIEGIILIIDDNSPDHTADIVKKFMTQSTKVDLLFRTTKEGLGKAYIAGFEYAIAKYNPKFIFEMDADLSHPPEVFPEMLDKLRSNQLDFVVGSRKISGGGTENWGWNRKLISSGGNFYTRMLLGLKIHDVTSGYRGFRTKYLQEIELSAIDSSGYSFQIEVAFMVEKLLKARSGEAPIIFVDRKLGKSKLGLKDIIEFFIEVQRLFLFGWRRRQKLAIAN